MADPRPDVDAHGARQLQVQGVVLLDVREFGEWAAGHAPGAVHVPLARLDPGRLDPGAAYFTVCRSGGRSALAAALLGAAGLDVTNLAGGMTAWARARLPVVRDDRSPGEIV